MNEDFGDAPASYDPTAAASHVVGDLKLGATIDAENPDTLNGATAVTPSPNAVLAGADNNGTNGDGADEDAITTFPALTTADNAYSLTVPISGASAAGRVCGWVDYNRNGVFDTGERTCATFAAGATSVTLSWTGLTGLTTGTNYVRLRASYNATGVQDPTGRLDSGEVEDYRLTITAPTFNVSKSFAPTTVSAGGVTALNITVTNPYPFATSALAITDNIAATMGLSLPLPLRVTANTCGGSFTTPTVSGVALATGGRAEESTNGTLSLTGGTVAANGTCSVTVDVTVVNAGAATRTNTIPAANVTGTVNAQAATGAAPATANLTTTASAAGTLYTCDARFYQLRQNTATLLSNLYLLDRNNLASGGTAQWSTGFGPGLNALAFNKADGYFYAVNITPFTTGNPFRLYRLGSSGAVEVSTANLGIPSGSTIAAATIDASGTMYIKKLTNDAVIYKYNIGTGATSTLTINGGAGLNIFDLAFNPVDGFLYGVVTPGGVYRINASTGATTLLGSPAAGAADFSNYIGSAFFDVSGTLYAYQNGGTYGTISTTTGAFTTLATGAVAAQSDGASCVFPDNRIDAVKSVGTVTANSALVFDVPYTVTVKNTGTVSNPNVQLTEDLNRTFTTGTPTLSIVAGPTVTSGAVTANTGFNGTTDTALLTGANTMAAGASATITFTVRVTYPNQASVPASGSVLNNTVYASTTGSAPNPGYTFVGGTAIPPVDLLATDASTNGSTPPATANSDTQSPTPVTLPDVADLAIDKSGPVAVGSGGTVTYTIRVWNNGPRSVTGASVTDALPAGFTVTALTCAATGTATCGSQTFPGNVVTITTGALSVDTTPANAAPDGNFLTYALTGTAPASGTLSNTASVTVPAGAADPTPANNTSAAAVTRVVDAVNDTGAVTFGQGTTFNILGSDTVGGAAATTTNATLPVIVNNGGLTGLSVNASGQLVLAASLLNVPGTYTVTYRICDATLTTACDEATIAITVTPAAADLGIVKSQRLGTTGTFQTTPLSVTQGSTVQYQIVVTNSGPSAVTNSTFTDAVPANLTGLSVVSAAGTGTTCTATFTGSTLNGSFSGSSGQTCTVTIQGTTTTTGTFTNTATVTAPSGITDATTGNNSSSVNTTVTPAADLAIDKSGPLAVGSGGAVTYTIRVWNNGPSSVTGASVTDALPAGFTVTALTCAATGTATCGTQTSTASSVTITTGALSLDTNTANATPDGNFLTYTLTGTASASGTLSNTASVTAPTGTTDPTPANNTSGAVTTRVIDAVTDPAVNFGFGAGGTVTVLGNDTVGGAVATTTNATVTVQNNGGITGLTVNAGGQLVVPAGTPAGTYTVTYQLCDAAVTAACDTATVQVTVNAAATSDLAVSKTGPAFAQPGGTVTYTIRAWNNGTSASSATVTDTVPADLTGVSWTCAGTGGATCAAPSGTGNNVSVGATLPVDTGAATTADTAFVTVTVTATAPSTATLSSTPAARTITNTASVSGPNTDPTPANNSASAVTNMVYGKLTKEVRNVTTNTAFGTSGGGLPGEILEYCIAFENLGGAALPNFVVVDHVPGNTNALTTAYDADEPSVTIGFGVKLTRGALTSYLSSSAADTDGGSLTTTGGTFTRGTMTVSLGTLAPGESGRTCFQTTIR
ncbi:beta strand repeat-containing protein [Deinococcus aquaticus]|uniref:beta strand repeat-containing protein n=1 Tax=Deinococcus aquaticus TaxID=328692 RepID=UPI003F44B181